MSMWVDKYRPTSLDKLDYHTKQAQRLKYMVQQGDFPHVLVHGPPGAGKRTRIMCILRELYGSGVDKIRQENVTFETPSKKKLEITTLNSNYHIEVNASDAGIYDRIVVMELIKTTAQTHQIDPSGQREFKVVLLTNVDRLTKDAQQALRRTMEKYISTCRIILCTETMSRVLPAIQSRCLPIRVPAPTELEIKNVLQIVCQREGLTLPDFMADKVIKSSGRNLRRVILMLEAAKVKQYPFSENQAIDPPDWQVYINQTAKQMTTNQSAEQILAIRNRLQELIVHGIPSELIFRSLMTECLKHCDNELKCRVVEMAAHYEHMSHRGSKIIFHLEAFVANFMEIYREYLDSMGDLE